jgi:periplasmic copper chaperone A
MSRRALPVILAALLVLSVFAVPAAAHVTANPNEASSPYFKTSFRVPHGCDGSATTAVRVQIPEGVTSVKPQVVAGWEIEIVRTDLDEPVEGGHGETITDRVSEIIWTGGPLPDEHLQEFGLSMRLPDVADVTDGVLWFPTIQECEEGETRWIEIPASVEEWGDLDEPAPYVRLAAASGDGHGTSDDDDDEEAADDVATDDDAATDDDEVSTDDAEPVAAVTQGADTLTVVALVAGLLGLALGGGAFVRAGHRT